jgi:FtsH-binding integral membrane protein
MGTIRWSAFAGIVIFILFLLVDFSILSAADKSGVNDWNSAFVIAFQIYLDIMNLLLQILEAMGN